MSDFAWCVIENIAWCLAFMLCVFFLPEWWKLLGLAPLGMVNTKYPVIVTPTEGNAP